MHSYLRAIGFANITKESEVEKLLEDVYKKFDHREAVREDDTVFIEMEKEFAPDMGIKLCGDVDGDGFHRQYYFPYYKGRSVTTSEEVSVERRVNGDSFAGICDDGRVGVSLIFYLQNAARYRQEQILNQLKGIPVTTTFTGLSSGGKILFPVAKKASAENMDFEKKSVAHRSQLMSAAKNGDPDAIESLTIEDMDLYSMVSRRVYKEDVFSIVDTFFMPYGMECDQYQILGNIEYCQKVQNTVTDEYVYQMTLECNDMYFDICVNAKDLLGVPEIGRRFKGNIWLQGQLNFDL